jgi:carbamoyl-phosphate synthase large subunit
MQSTEGSGVMVATFVVSSAGRRGHLVKILQQVARQNGGKVIAVDASPLSAAGVIADRFEVVPPVDSPAFTDHLLDVCQRHRADILVPTIDTELACLATARPHFEERGVQIWVSKPEVIELGSDKWLFHTWLSNHGFNRPAAFLASDPRANSLTGDVVAKPRHGSASNGLRWANHVATLLPDLHNLDNYLIQERALGYEVTVDFAVDGEGRLRGIGARRRLEVRSGEVSKAVTVQHRQLGATVQSFIEELSGAFGVLNVQVFVDEVENRIQFLACVFHACGA